MNAEREQSKGGAGMKLRSGLGLVVGIGIGYVLGSRAGRGRYEQIRSGWEEFAQTPAVQRAVEPIKEVVEPVLRAARTGTDDLPEPTGVAALSADQLKERLRRAGTVEGSYPGHPPEEIIKERM
jgi:hypothetical protein